MKKSFSLFFLILTIPHLISAQAEEKKPPKWGISINAGQSAAIGRFAFNSRNQTAENAALGAQAGADFSYIFPNNDRLVLSLKVGSFFVDAEGLTDYYSEQFNQELSSLDIPNLFYNNNSLTLGYELIVYELSKEFTLGVRPFIGYASFKKENHSYSFPSRDRDVKSTIRFNDFETNSFIYGFALTFNSQIDIGIRKLNFVPQVEYAFASYDGSQTVRVNDFENGSSVSDSEVDLFYAALTVSIGIGFDF